MILRYGAMQVDVIALLAEARQRINANVASIEAQREFWLANTDLGVAVVGGGVSGMGEAPRTIASGAAEPAGGH
jgi:NADH dehydrogenase FAD-containing subunit